LIETKPGHHQNVDDLFNLNHSIRHNADRQFTPYTAKHQNQTDLRRWHRCGVIFSRLVR